MIYNQKFTRDGYTKQKKAPLGNPVGLFKTYVLDKRTPAHFIVCPASRALLFTTF
jgi:hypothetical protein